MGHYWRMLPYSVEYEFERKPVATVSLIMANAMLLTVWFSKNKVVLDALLFWPDRFAPWQFITGVFLHAGLMHLAGNMLFLWIYGRYVEERLGPWRFLLVYFACSLGADLTYLLVHLGKPEPSLGASGAISGLLGIVIVAAPMLKVNCIWVHYYPRLFTLPAVAVLGLWLFEQIGMALVLGDHGVAVSAHLGGFFTGAALGVLLKQRSLKGSAWYLAPEAADDFEQRTNRSFQAAMLAAQNRAQATPDPTLRVRRAVRFGPTQDVPEQKGTYTGPLSLVEDAPRIPSRRISG